MEGNRQEALNKAKKAQQMMLLQAEMEKQMQPTVAEVQADSISMQPAINPNPKPQGAVIGADIYSCACNQLVNPVAFLQNLQQMVMPLDYP